MAKETNYNQTPPATLRIEATIGDSDLDVNETTPFTVLVRNTGNIPVQPITVGCDLAGGSDPGVALFGHLAAAPVPIATALVPLGAGEAVSRHWVVFNAGTGAGANPPFTITITVTDPNNVGGVAHSFVCP